MQQPDFRDQSEPEANDEIEENSQSDSNELQNQETSQLQHEEKETDGAKVRGSKSQSDRDIVTCTKMHTRPEISELVHLAADS